MIFRQLFEPGCSGYTYLLACESSLQALLIDPVIETVERDIAFLRALGLTLSCTLETHIHADHVTGAGRLRELTGSKIAVPSRSAACYVDIGISEEEPISLGSLVVQPLYTPGHTADHHSYVLRSGGQGRVFTGDALLIDGCGRTDFQEGDAPTLYQSVHEKIFSLPDDTLVYPGHDYQRAGSATSRRKRLAIRGSAVSGASMSLSPSCGTSSSRALQRWTLRCPPTGCAANFSPPRKPRRLRSSD